MIDPLTIGARVAAAGAPSAIEFGIAIVIREQS